MTRILKCPNTRCLADYSMGYSSDMRGNPCCPDCVEPLTPGHYTTMDSPKTIFTLCCEKCSFRLEGSTFELAELIEFLPHQYQCSMCKYTTVKTKSKATLDECKGMCGVTLLKYIIENDNCMKVVVGDKSDPQKFRTPKLRTCKGKIIIE